MDRNRVSVPALPQLHPLPRLQMRDAGEVRHGGGADFHRGDDSSSVRKKPPPSSTTSPETRVNKGIPGSIQRGRPTSPRRASEIRCGESRMTTLPSTPPRPHRQPRKPARIGQRAGGRSRQVTDSRFAQEVRHGRPRSCSSRRLATPCVAAAPAYRAAPASSPSEVEDFGSSHFFVGRASRAPASAKKRLSPPDPHPFEARPLPRQGSPPSSAGPPASGQTTAAAPGVRKPAGNSQRLPGPAPLLLGEPRASRFGSTGLAASRAMARSRKGRDPRATAASRGIRTHGCRDGHTPAGSSGSWRKRLPSVAANSGALRRPSPDSLRRLFPRAPSPPDGPGRHPAWPRRSSHPRCWSMRSGNPRGSSSSGSTIRLEGRDAVEGDQQMGNQLGVGAPPEAQLLDQRPTRRRDRSPPSPRGFPPGSREKAPQGARRRDMRQGHPPRMRCGARRPAPGRGTAGTVQASLLLVS